MAEIVRMRDLRVGDRVRWVANPHTPSHLMPSRKYDVAIKLHARHYADDSVERSDRITLTYETGCWTLPLDAYVERDGNVLDR